MKKIITIIALAFATLTLSAKEVAKNPMTNMVLSENAGIYTITGKNGAIILGNKEQAGDFLVNAMDAFLQESLHRTLNVGEDKLEVLKDDAGLYLIKVGLGGAKLRKGDVIIFGTALGCQSIAKYAKESFKEGKDYFKKVKDTLRNN